MTAPTIRSYMQIFSRFGGTRHRKVHFSTFSGKRTFQSSRNGIQNPPYCPGSLQDTFIIYSSISHQHLFRKYFPTNNNLEKRKSENLKFQKPRFANKCPELITSFSVFSKTSDFLQKLWVRLLRPPMVFVSPKMTPRKCGG